jgi:fatty-acyl-CoA synthase
MVSRIAAAWERTRAAGEPADLSSWAWMGIADFQGRSRELAAWAEREFGTVSVGVYGSSEIFALTAFWRADTDEARRWSGGGYPVSPAVQVRAADPFTGEVLAAGAEGELQFRGPNVVDAYLGDTGEAAAAFTADGWFRTGDFGTVCEDGAFVYSSRMGDVLRLKGFLVHPSEIEFRLGAHPAVDTAKVVGYRGPNGETRAIAFVTLGACMSADEAELQQWCRAELARYKVPSSIYVVDSMPTTAGTNGTKIRTAALREWARERQEAVAVGSAQHAHTEGI